MFFKEIFGLLTNPAERRNLSMIDAFDKRWLFSKRMLKLMLIALMVLGCASSGGSGGQQNEKAIIGGLGGAAAGGLIAAAFHGGPAGVIGGILAGGLIGGAIGDRMDAADRREAQQTTQQALEKTPSGTAVAWHNPDSGHSGTVTPVRTFQKSSGQYCREYQQTVSIGGEEQQAYGTACRQPDGSWKIVK
jgi:surface antigen